MLLTTWIFVSGMDRSYRQMAEVRASVIDLMSEAKVGPLRPAQVKIE